jgi:thiamine-phosphate pyrophosphorylase
MSMPKLLTILGRFESRQTCVLPRLLVLTDSARGYDLPTQKLAWPIGVAFIERTFDKPPSKQLTQQVQLATCSPRQARKAGLDGVHWPHARLKYRRMSASLGLIETGSAHSGLEIAKAHKLGLDVVLIGTAFPSNSPSAKRPLGPIRLARLQRAFPNVVLFALGGITYKTAPSLRRTKLYGVGLVSFSLKQ